MLAVADAEAMVAAAFEPLAAEQVAVSSALGRVLAEDVRARIAHPPVDVSAMDGYAVRAGDVGASPCTLRLIGEAAAGHPFTGRLGAGEVVRIMTGAAIPAGADAIVIQEDTERDGDVVRVRETPVPGRWIRRAGLDFRAGDVLLAAGQRLSARDVALAAAMNMPWLMVRRRPRVAIVATGDELVMPGEALDDGCIVSSNTLALAAFVVALGGEAIDLGIARDDAQALRTIVAGARGADLLVTSGGASVGDHDLVRSVLGEEELTLRFFRVAMRPGKPLIFGRLGSVPMLGLPGNPVSVGVTARIFVKIAMDRMLGLAADDGATSARLGRDLPANDERQEYLRASLARDGDGGLVATPFDRQDSAMLGLLAAADCLIVRPPHAPAIGRGTSVPILQMRLAAMTT